MKLKFKLILLKFTLFILIKLSKPIKTIYFFTQDSISCIHQSIFLIENPKWKEKMDEFWMQGTLPSGVIEILK